MSQKSKDTTKDMPGLAKVEPPVRKFAGRTLPELTISPYDVILNHSNRNNDAHVVVMRDGRELGRYTIPEFETILVDAVMITNIGGTRFSGMGLGNPKLHIGYATQVD
ncbi:MAG: hypothetical protein PHF60_03185 [Candidatus ainarchaeum sp.]|nr:hypothetical protein [Candidatus ainarchaeum sp.]